MIRRSMGGDGTTRARERRIARQHDDDDDDDDDAHDDNDDAWMTRYFRQLGAYTHIHT